MADPSPGDRIAKDLVLQRRLVRGGMGVVWVARHEGLGADVAVKLLVADFADDEGVKKRFAREAAASMEVQSPHVVQMLDYGITNDGAPYLVMELLSGDDLETHIASGPLPPSDVVSIVTQVAQALNRAHERNVLHRDIKPANIFLVPSDGFTADKYFVKLLDFGLAKQMDRLTTQLTAQGTIVGTPEYMSPEHMMGAKLDPRADLFSLAVVAFEAFTGKRPFHGKSLRELSDAITQAPTPRPTAFNPSLPSGLDAWFAKACARDRDDRFASARELIAGLYSAFAPPAQPVVADEPAPDAHVTAPRASRLRVVAVIVAIIVVAIAVAFIVHFAK